MQSETSSPLPLAELPREMTPKEFFAPSPPAESSAPAGLTSPPSIEERVAALEQEVRELRATLPRVTSFPAGLQS